MVQFIDNVLSPVPFLIKDSGNIGLPLISVPVDSGLKWPELRNIFFVNGPFPDGNRSPYRSSRLKRTYSLER